MKQVLIVIMAFIAFSCGQKKAEKINPNSHEIVVVEVLQTSAYTYVRYTENGMENWLATSVIDANVGDKFYYEKSMEMNNFHSKELNRDFESILFVDKLSNNPIENDSNKPSGPGSEKAKAGKVNVEFVKTTEELSIANIYSNKDTYSNKKILIKGKVVKVSPNIMSKNWVHIQDGTEFEGNYDLTVTTLAELKVGDVVTFEGIIALDKDFGHGYKYDVILEEAAIK